MAFTLRTFLSIVAAGAFFLPLVGPLAGIAIGAQLTRALTVGSIILSALLVKRPTLGRQQIAVQTALDPGTPLPVVYGRAKVGSIVVDWFLKPGDRNKILYMVSALCHGSRDGLGIAAIEEIWLDQKRAVQVLIDSEGPPYNGPSRQRGFGQAIVNYKAFLGTAVQNVGGTVLTGWGDPGVPQVNDETLASVAESGWDGNTDQGRGVACLVFRLANLTLYLPESEGGPQPAFRGPPAVSAIVQGNRVYDTRTAAWVPGGDNPVMCTRDFLLSAIYGPGVPASWIHEASAKDAADYCDEAITIESAEATVFTSSVANPSVIQASYSQVSAGISTSSVANPTVITTTAPHNYKTGDQVRITGHTGSTPSLNGVHAITVTGATTFTIPVSVSVGGTGGTAALLLNGYHTGDTVRIAGHAGSSPSINGDHVITVTGPGTFTIPVNVTVAGSGGTAKKLTTQKRFTCNGVVDTGQPVSASIGELLSSFRGALVWEQGQFKFVIRRETVTDLPDTGVPVPTLDLNVRNIRGAWRFRNAGLEEKWNIVKASYVDPAGGTFRARDVQWPPVGAANAYLVADNNYVNRLELSLPFTNDQLMAQTIAQVVLNEGRQGISVQIRVTEEALKASVGDLVTITHPSPGWDAKTFWVDAMQSLPSTEVDLTLREFDPAAYALTTLSDVRTFPDETLGSLTEVPAPGAVTVTSGTSLDRILISWGSADYGLIDHYEVQARQTDALGDNVYRTVGRAFGVGAVREVAHAGVRNGQSWQARVRVLNVGGHASDWTESAVHVVQVHDVPVVTITVTGATDGVEVTVTNYDTDGDGIDAARAEIYVRENDAAAGADPVETEPYHAAALRPGDGPLLVPAASGKYVRAFAVPYNAFGERGILTVVSEAASGAAGSGPTAPPTAIACASCS
jgi:putative tail protein